LTGLFTPLSRPRNNRAVPSPASHRNLVNRGVEWRQARQL